MAKSPRIVQTPGAEPAAATDSALDPDGNPGGDVDQADGDTGEPESEADELARLRAENAKLKAEGDERKQRDASIAAADRAAMSERLTSNKPVRGLQPEDVDPSKIKRAVLTEKGWVCPSESPVFSQAR